MGPDPEMCRDLFGVMSTPLAPAGGVRTGGTGDRMRTALQFALVGFLAGVAVALALTQIGNQRPLPSNELHVLWPAAAIGLDFNDWADGNSWHFLRFLAVFLGNGVVYAVVAGCFGGVVEFVKK